MEARLYSPWALTAAFQPMTRAMAGERRAILQIAGNGAINIVY